VASLAWPALAVAFLLLAAYGFYCTVRMSQNRIPGFKGLLGAPGSLTPVGMQYSRRFTICWALALLVVLVSWFID
jgi:hypothetical protein